MRNLIIHIFIIFVSIVSVSTAQENISLKYIDSENKSSYNLSKGFSDEVKLIDTLPQDNSYELLNKGYNYINTRQYNEAISVFNAYLIENPNDTKIHMQLGYLYDIVKNYSDALKSFSYVVDNSTDSEEISKARTSITYLNDKISKNNDDPIKAVLKDSIPLDNSTDLLNKGYNYINGKQYSEAISVFNTYLIKNPKDTKIHMQLGYLYDANKMYDNAYKSFEYVADNSSNPDEIDKARTSMYFLRDLIIKNSPASLDLYFYNFYDSYYQNYVANLLTHINLKLAKGIYVGPYFETYLDSKSKSDFILNDRFVDIGAFTKFNITSWLNFEVRVGYVREIDFQKSSLSFKPILSMGTRFGQATFYKSRNTNKTTNFYFDVYASGLYDYKFRNVFGDVMTKEVLRFLTGGYSYLEFYLKQELAADSKQLNYNNYIDLGGGITFKPNLIDFPVLFLEGLNRNFVIGSVGNEKNIFTVRAGFLLYLNTKL